MGNPGDHSLREITTQTESWQGALKSVELLDDALLTLVRRNTGRRILFIGCGSTHYLAQFAAPYFQGVTGMPCRAVPSSELLLLTDTVVTSDEPAPLVVALSRSGETSETVLAVQKMRARGSDALTISCYEGTPLSAASALTVGIAAGREESYAQTRSFAGMLVAVQALAALVADDEALMAELRRLPALGGEVIRRSEGMARSFCKERYKRITYLGSGALYGLAGEATVKMKEMSLSTAEGFHFMEFRHGPMALVDEEHLTVGLLSDGVRDYEVGVLRDLRARGGQVLAVGHDVEGLLGTVGSVFDLGAPLSERARAVLYLPFLQLLAYYRAMGRGLDPDRPRNVVMAIRLDGTEMA